MGDTLTTQTAQPSTGVLSNVQLAPNIEPGQIVMIIIYLVVIVIAAYYLTQFVGRRRLQQGMHRENRTFSSGVKSSPGLGHMIYVVDRIAIDREKTLMVVEFDGKYYLIGTTPQDMRLLGNAPVPEPGQQQNAGTAPAAGSVPPDGESADGETFQQRFRRAFSIVLQSYLPARFRKPNASQKTGSFDEQMRARMHSDTPDAGKQASFEDTMAACMRTDSDADDTTNSNGSNPEN